MLALAALLGLVMGAVIGGLGGGGGVLTVPALVYLLGQSAQDATTASVVVVGITAAAGVLARARTGGIDWRTGLVFGVVGLPAAWLGTVLNDRVSQPTLLLAFAGLALVAAAAMLLHARATRRADEHADQDASPDHDRAETVADEHRDAAQARTLGGRRGRPRRRWRCAGVAPTRDPSWPPRPRSPWVVPRSASSPASSASAAGSSSCRPW